MESNEIWEILTYNQKEPHKLYYPDGKEITSVVRKSDNLIFSIDDVCKLGPFYEGDKAKILGKITRLWISGDQLRVDFGRVGLVLAWKYHEDLIFK